MSIGKRIRQVRGKESREEFAQSLGIHPQTLYRYESGGRSVDSELVALLCERYQISSEWLIFGSGPMSAAARPVGAQTVTGGAASGAAFGVSGPRATEKPRMTPEIVECPDCQITLIPMVEARLSAGNGSFEVGGDVEGRYAFRSDFLARKGQAARMVLMRVDGDSMAPEIRNGDVVLLDQSQKELRAGKIYAIGVEDLVYLKKVDTRPGRIILSSLNPAYPPLEIDTRGDLQDGIRIIGRAVWWCRED